MESYIHCKRSKRTFSLGYKLFHSFCKTGSSVTRRLVLNLRPKTTVHVGNKEKRREEIRNEEWTKKEDHRKDGKP